MTSGIIPKQDIWLFLIPVTSGLCIMGTINAAVDYVQTGKQGKQAGRRVGRGRAGRGRGRQGIA